MQVKISIVSDQKDTQLPDRERIQGLEHSIANLWRGLHLYREDWINALKICFNR